MQGYYGGQQQPPQPPPGGGYAEYPHRPPTPPSPSDRSSSPPPQHREPGMWPCSRLHSAINLGKNSWNWFHVKIWGKVHNIKCCCFEWLQRLKRRLKSTLLMRHFLIAPFGNFSRIFLHFLADFRELCSNTIITITNVIPPSSSLRDLTFGFIFWPHFSFS